MPGPPVVKFPSFLLFVFVCLFILSPRGAKERKRARERKRASERARERDGLRQIGTDRHRERKGERGRERE